MGLLLKVVSGGQTGADRGGLDAAIVCEVPHGGWCPRGRRAEDGQVPRRYELVESRDWNYLERTQRNVVESDATVIFTGTALSGGSQRTADYAEAHGRPWLHLRLDEHDDEAAAARLEEFLNEHGIEVLNVAGSRGSREPGLHDRVFEVMCRLLQRQPPPAGRSGASISRR